MYIRGVYVCVIWVYVVYVCDICVCGVYDMWHMVYMYVCVCCNCQGSLNRLRTVLPPEKYEWGPCVILPKDFFLTRTRDLPFQKQQGLQAEYQMEVTFRLNVKSPLSLGLQLVAAHCYFAELFPACDCANTLGAST